MLLAALRYFLPIFALGFALGVLRTLWLAPAIGGTPAVLAELPIMLLASWALATRITRRETLSSLAALGTGVLAFLMLMGAELLLATLLAGQSAAQWCASLAEPPGSIGLAGQILFGLAPWLVRLRQSN